MPHDTLSANGNAVRSKRSRATKALRRTVVIAGTTLILLIVGADGYDAWRDYRFALAQNERMTGALSKALAEQTARMVQEVDVALSDFADWAQSSSGRTADRLVQIEMLRSRLDRLPFIQSATMIDADGRVFASTRAAEPTNVDWSGRRVFVELKQRGNANLYIDQPRITATGNGITIAMSRGLHRADGEFAGLIVARVAFDYLSRFYAAVDIAPQTSILLLRDDGVVLARYPEQPRPGEAHDPQIVDIAHAANGVWTSSSSDRATVSIARQEVEGYPMSMVIVQPIKPVLVAWRQQRLPSAMRTVALSTLAALLIAGLVSTLKRRERSDLERLRLEQQLRATQQAETLGMFAASIAHDFNNVLGAIVGYAEIARDALSHDAPAPRNTALANIERLLTASERARLLVRRILTFDLHRGVRDVPIAIESIVGETLEQLRATLPHNIAVRAENLHGTTMIRGDATEVFQVIANLCSNAVRAMPSGGVLDLQVEVVTIDAMTGHSMAVGVGRLTPGSWVRLTIADTGVGMTQSQQATVFEPFFTTKRAEPTAGIGLAVVGNIVTRMGGAVSVASELGRGSRFQVYWPLDNTPTNTAPETDAAQSGHGEVVMIVDDDAALVSIAEDLLAALGYEPVGFTDPHEALEAMRREPLRFDAVLTDENMPTLRGTALARTLCQLRPTLPIVIMTGHRDAHLAERANAVGADILDKPLRSEQLKSLLSKLLQHGAA